MLNFYRTIWDATWRQQITLIFLSITVAGLAAVPLKLQQLTINELVYGTKTLEKLAWLCAGYLAVVLLNAALKFLRRYKISLLAEGSVRRARELLYENQVAGSKRGTSGVPEKGTLLGMITSDAEDVGAFTGSAIADPLVLIGTLVSVIGFMMLVQPVLGIIALLILLPQAFIVIGIQKYINKGVRKRVQLLRSAADRIHESDLRQIEQGVLDDFDEIFETRRRISIFKLSSKTAMKVVNSTGFVAVLFLGGWMVIEDRTDIGTVVAVLTGLTQISGPWLEVTRFFRNANSMRVRFDLINDRIGLGRGAGESSGRIRV